MRVSDLQHDELLELDADGGVIRFAGERALLLDAVAMGLLRKILVENFGVTAGRAALTQLGFAHGWRTANAVKEVFTWVDEQEWRRAGPRVYALEGLFFPQPGQEDPLSEAGATLLASYEAEQHLLQLGRTDGVVCWTICGLLSGYVSRAVGEEIYVLEDRCVGEGHAACHFVGRTRAGWGEARAADLAFFTTELAACLDVSLIQVTETLKAAEAKLKSHKAALIRVEEPDLAEPLGVVARSAAMKRVVELAQRVAAVDVTVMITGESGVGKERIARLLHEQSARSGGPFIAINCGAVTETLLESELFGHARGAFTGAISDRPGLFEAASHGTLLLDEIGEVSPAMQVKLLRVLQEREIRRVGENKSRPVNVRVLAATNRDLTEAVASGGFRQDLYYRLKVVELHVPALRERREDILPLARVLLASACFRMKRSLSGLTPSAADQLVRYAWPGNVRELENAMERAAALARGTRVELDDLPEEVRVAFAVPTPDADAVQPLAAVEQNYILAVLELNDGNRTRTAEQLQIGSATLYRKLKKFGIADGPP